MKYLIFRISRFVKAQFHSPYFPKKSKISLPVGIENHYTQAFFSVRKDCTTFVFPDWSVSFQPIFLYAFDSLTSHLSNALSIISIRYVVIKKIGFENNPRNLEKSIWLAHNVENGVIIDWIMVSMPSSTRKIFLTMCSKNIISMPFHRPSHVLFNKIFVFKFGEILEEIWIFEIGAFKSMKK